MTPYNYLGEGWQPDEMQIMSRERLRERPGLVACNGGWNFAPDVGESVMVDSGESLTVVARYWSAVATCTLRLRDVEGREWRSRYAGQELELCEMTPSAESLIHAATEWGND